MNKLPLMINVLALSVLAVVAMIVVLGFNARFDLGEAAWGVVGIVMTGLIAPIPMIVKHYTDADKSGK